MLDLLVCVVLLFSPATYQDADERPSYRHLMVPASMSEAEFSWYVDVLDPSDTQRERLKIAFEVYEHSVQETLSEPRAELRELSRLASHASRHAADGGVEVFGDAMDKRAAYTAALDELDAVFFVNAEAALGPGAEAMLDFMQQNRRRFRLERIRSALPGADSDYIAMAIAIDDVSFNADLIELSTQYSRELVRLREKRDTIWTDQSLREVYLLSIMGAEHADFPELTQEEFVAMRRSASDEREKLAEQIYDVDDDLQAVNRRCYPRFQAALAAQGKGDAFEQRVRMHEYPTVYPDLVTAIPLLERALELEISDEVAQAIRAQLESASARRDIASQRLARRVDEWRHLSSKTLSFMAWDQRDYMEDMVELESARVAISRECVAMLRSVLPPDVAEGFVELKQLEEKLATHDPLRRYFGNPNARRSSRDR